MPAPALLPNEHALYEGSAESAPFTRGIVLSYVALLGVGALMLVVGWLTIRGMATTSVSFSLYSIQFRGSNAAGTFSSSAGVLNPLAFVALIAFLELHRQALARSLTLVVTPRRLLLTRGVFRTKVESVARTGEEHVDLREGTLTVTGAASPLRLDGFSPAAKDGIAHALEAFNPAPVPDPPPPLWNRKRVAVVALAALVALSLWAFVHATAAPTLAANWKPGTATAMGQIEVRLERPIWTDDAGWQLKGLETSVDGKPQTASSGAGGSNGLFRAERRMSEFLPAKGREAQLTCVLARPDGSEHRVEFTLRPGDTQTKPLD